MLRGNRGLANQFGQCVVPKRIALCVREDHTLGLASPLHKLGNLSGKGELMIVLRESLQRRLRNLQELQDVDAPMSHELCDHLV